MIKLNNKNNHATADAKKKYKEYKRRHRNYKLISVVIVLIVLAVGILASVLWDRYRPQEESTNYNEGELQIEKLTEINDSVEIEMEIEQKTVVPEEIEQELDVEDSLQEEVDSYMNSMNLESKVAQLFITTPEELTGIGIAVQAGETTKQKIKTYAIGGLIFTEQNFESLDQIQLMLNSLRVYTKTPLFLVIDEVGATRVTNTNTSLYDTGFNLESIENQLYCLSSDSSESTALANYFNVLFVNDDDVVSVFNEGYELLVVQDDFIEMYEQMVEAVRTGEISEESLDDVVEKILTYKVNNNI
ncbi:MAG: hypothetical protein R3Y58_03350 [Eubacteriales bacterium]